MINSNDLRTGNEVLVENPYGGGCYSITILQNWRDILTVSRRGTSGSRASDVWSEEEVYEITSKELCDELNEEIIAPYGWDISIIRSFCF